MMATPILQEFLNQQLITPDQEDYITGLQKAADELEKKLRSKRSRIPQVVLLAFDPQAAAEEALFAEVQDLIVAKWRNFASKCQDRPVTYLRAVMLTALEALATDPRLAGIIWLTASNYFRYTSATHREAAVLQRFLTAAGNLYEQTGWKSWEAGGGEKLPNAPAITHTAVGEVPMLSSDYAEKQLRASVTTVDKLTSNSKTFHQVTGSYVNNGTVSASEAWATDFGTIAGKAVTSVANSVIKEVNKIITSATSQSDLTEYNTKITQYLGNVSAALARQTFTYNLRSRLLWLKESQYSVSQRQGYRSIAQSARPVVLAYDAAQQVPEVYPASVEYFLRETLLVADAQAEEEITFAKLLADLANSAATWQAILVTVAAPEPGRQPLLAFMARLGQTGNEPEQLAPLTGLTLTDITSRADVAVWLFRELEVQKLLAAK